MTALHTYFYIVVDTQWGCHTLKLQYGKLLPYQNTQYRIFRQHYKLLAGSRYFGLLASILFSEVF